MEKCQISKLSNGLRVVSCQMPYLQSVAISLIIKVGSRYESAGEHGVCHFLEHMAFKGTANRSARQIAEEFDSIGGLFNAHTSREYTVYHAKVLSENLGAALNIIADIVQYSALEQADIEKEYQVICQEIASSLDSPEDLAYDKLIESAFAGQPLGRSILGTPGVLANFNTRFLQNYIKKHYTAANMVLSVAGKVYHKDLLNLAKLCFNSLTSATSTSFIKASYTPKYNLIDKELEQSTLFIGYKGISYIHRKELYCSQMLSLILGGGISSRLFQRIREDLGLAYSVGTFTNIYCDTGLFGMYVSTAHNNVQKAYGELIVEVEKICNNVTDVELIRAKSQIKANLLMAEEKNAYKAEEMGKNVIIFGKHIDLEELLENLRTITKHDVIQIAQKIFVNKLTLSLIGQNANKFILKGYERLN